MPDEAKQLYINKINNYISALKDDPTLFNSWLILGIYRKQIGDYEGARQAWDYVGKISPGNSTSFNNLGNLYAYYIKDNQKAEENFLKAIKNGPDMVYIYRNLYEFYRYVMKDDIKAKAILAQGIAANPDTSQDLQYLLDNY
jgi:tetratricopeptide (TPR) repeat protein